MRDCRKLIKGLLLVVGFVFVGCNNSDLKEYVYTGSALGTTYQVKFFHSEEIAVEKGLDSIFEVVNQSMSTYREDSDISRINRGDTTVVVDENFVEVYHFSEQIYRESNGYFDPTVGNLVNAYGFGSGRLDPDLSSTEIDSLLQFVGFNKIRLNQDNTISKTHSNVYLEFNAIAKGYAVDVVARFLDQNGVNDYLIEVGGELVAKGNNRDKEQAWVVGIDDPSQTKDNRTFKATIELRDRAMATSGNYRKFRVDSITGRRFVHTINPLTGQPEKSNLLSATVLAENCTLADGYATAFMALGFQRSIEMLPRLKNVDVYFIYAEENEEVKEYLSGGMEEILSR